VRALVESQSDDGESTGSDRGQENQVIHVTL
jgi:hypothetical protein